MASRSMRATNTNDTLSAGFLGVASDKTLTITPDTSDTRPYSGASM